jgi:hypothetical protein
MASHLPQLPPFIDVGRCLLGHHDILDIFFGRSIIMIIRIIRPIMRIMTIIIIIIKTKKITVMTIIIRQ